MQRIDHARRHDRPAFRQAVLSRLEADPSIHGDEYTARLEELLDSAEQAIGEVLESGEIDRRLKDHIESVAWTAVNEIPLDVIDDLSIAFIVEAAERSRGDGAVVRAAVQATLSWYEGFWPFEHPDAVVQAVQFGNIAKRIPAPVFMANRERRITFSSKVLDDLLCRPRGFNERHSVDTLFEQELAIGADHPTRVVLSVGQTSATALHLDVTVLPIQTPTGIEYFGYVEDRTREVVLEQMRNGVVGAISHELRTPLTAMIGYLDLIAEGAFVGEDLEEALSIVRSESGLLLRLVTDIVEFSKLTAGTAVLDRSDFSLPDLVHESIRRAMTGCDKTVSVNVETGLSMKGDRDRMGQLLTNLLTNARRYGGERIEVSAWSCRKRLHVVVEDDGPGIPEHELRSIFDPFVQGSQRHRGEGAGLGLAICSGIVTSLGGTLSVTNTPGARFEARFALSSD